MHYVPHIGRYVCLNKKESNLGNQRLSYAYIFFFRGFLFFPMYQFTKGDDETRYYDTTRYDTTILRDTIPRYYEIRYCIHENELLGATPAPPAKLSNSKISSILHNGSDSTQLSNSLRAVISLSQHQKGVTCSLDRLNLKRVETQLQNTTKIVSGH